MGNTRVWCETCKVPVERQNMELHINGKKHQKALSEAQKESNIVLTNVKHAEDVGDSSGDTSMCNVCGVPIPAGGRKIHVEGKKHKSKLQQIEGAVQGTTSSDNTAVAEGTSEVSTSVEQQQNSTETTTKCDARNVKVKPSKELNHVNSGKHKDKVLLMESSKKNKTYGVSVIDFPSAISKKDLVEYFGKFGGIKFCRFEGKCLNIHYRDPFSVETVLGTPHYFQDTPLTVTQFTPKETAGKNLVKELDLTAVTGALKGVGNLDQQIAVFLHMVKPPYHIILEKYKALCYDLETTLKRVFKSCQVHAFGSTVTGLCFKDSDVDVFVQLPKDAEYQSSDVVLKKARRALFQSRIFNDIVCIFNARTPIVKCLHVPTNIKCDFNFKTMLGVCNSRLIGYYLSLDHKLMTAMLILKYWARVHELTGPQKLTNYALTMLMIFYLQHPPFNLPSVKSLQSNILFEQDGWNGGFLPLEGFQSEALKNATVLDLLKGFFEFYTVFDFGLYVICPLIGIKLPKFAFFQTDTLPDDFSRYKQQGTTLVVDTSICVQDPFELSRNLTVSIPIKGLTRFISYCERGVAVSRGAELSLLCSLFTMGPEVKEVSSSAMHFQLRLDGHLKYIYDHLDPAERTIDAIEKAWFEHANTFLLSVLTSVWKLEVEAQPVASPSKSLRLEGQRDVHDGNVVDAIIFRCTGEKYLWEQRKSWSKQFGSSLPQTGNSLEKEIALTEAVCEHAGNLREVLVDFNMRVTAKTKPTLVEVEMKRIRGDLSAFHKLGLFFVLNYSQWFWTYLDEKSKSVINQTGNSDT